MAKEVTMYQSDDGQVFRTADMCNEYNAAKQDEKKIAAFLASKLNPYQAKAHKTVAKSAIEAFCEYLRSDHSSEAKGEEKIEDVKEEF